MVAASQMPIEGRVQSGRGIAREDDPGGIAGVEEMGDGFPCREYLAGSFHCKAMPASPRVAALVFSARDDGFPDRIRFRIGRCRVVQVNQGCTTLSNVCREKIISNMFVTFPAPSLSLSPK